MNRSQRALVADRERGRHRVGQVTRWTAAGGGLAAAVIAVLLAQGPATASTAATTTVPDPEQGPAPGAQAGSPDAAQYPAPQYSPQDGQQGSDQGLQPPVVVPRHSRGGGSHALSGAS